MLFKQTLDNRGGAISRSRFPSSDKDSQSYPTLDNSSSKAIKEFSVSSNNNSSSSVKGTQTDKDPQTIKSSTSAVKSIEDLSQVNKNRARLFVAIEEARNLPRFVRGGSFTYSLS